MTIIGFPAAVEQAFKEGKIIDQTWDMELGKPYGDINGEVKGSPASEILKKASGLIDGERAAQHGDRKECHTLIARMWTAFKGVEFTANEVACMMVLLKIARTKSGSYNGDCYVDAAGYSALAGELADVGC